MSEDDMLSRMTTNVSPNSTTKRKKVKMKEAPVVRTVESKRSFCDKHPKVCKAGRTVGKGAAVAGMGVLTVAAAGELATEKAVEGIMWLGENTYSDGEPTRTTVRKSEAPKKRTTAKKKTANAPRKTATRKKTTNARKSTPKKKTASKRTTTRKKSNRRTSYVANPDYWRL